jgi:signal transduction histidine kinase
MDHSAQRLAQAVGLQTTRLGAFASAAAASRQLLQADSAFAAVAEPAGGYPMLVTEGVRDGRFRSIVVRPGAGLGGQVLLQRRPLSVADYEHDPTISRDFVEVVCNVEGLRAMACVPIGGPDRVEALLYASTRGSALPGDRALDALGLVATYAAVAIEQVSFREQEVELALLRERQRVAARLHDSVAQLLFGIGVSAHYARRQDDPATLHAAMEEIELSAARARSHLRESLLSLGESPEGLSFEARLLGETRLLAKSSGCEVRFARRGERRELPRDVEELVLDTAVEGVRNGVKHAGSRLALLHLAYKADGVALAIQTDGDPGEAGKVWRPGEGGKVLRPGEVGAGLRPGEGGAGGPGAGLVLLGKRAALLRGRLELAPSGEGHAVLTLEVPLISRGGAPA